MPTAPTLPVPQNPFRPGAGQRPLYLAGRTYEQDQFRRFLRQDPVTQNVILTGLRGVGKTVLLELVFDVATSRKIAEQHALAISDQFRLDVLVGRRIFQNRADMHSAFMCKGALPYKRLIIARRQIRAV